MGSQRGADMIADYLQREGVRHVFTLCGHGNVGMLDALVDRAPEISTISVHHESVAGFMADAYFRVLGRPAVTLTSCGPGSANLPIALANALMDSSAFLAITGDVPTSQFNREPFQESGYHFQADFPSVVRPYVKRSLQATRTEQLPTMLRVAFSLMLSQPFGPVNLDVPFDVFAEQSDEPLPDPSAWHARVSGHQGAAPGDIAKVVAMLQAAERPLLVAGRSAGVGEAADQLLALAEQLALPVAWTPDGKGCIDGRHPLAIGATGRNGTLTANRAASNADLIIAVSASFDDRATSSWLNGYTFTIPPTRLVQVDVDVRKLARNYPVQLAVVADPATFLRQLQEAFRAGASHEEVTWQPWRGRIAEWRREWDEHAQPRRLDDAVPIRPERLIADLRSVFPEDGILLSDVGVHHNWIVQEWEAWRPNTLLQTWGFGAMGFGAAGALGAKVAAPDRAVLAVVGDGGFLMNASVVATAVEYDLPVIWLVWNNGGYISIRDIQRGYLGREFVTTFSRRNAQPYSPDYAALARSMGASAYRVTKPAEVAESVRDALDHQRPCVIDVLVDSERGPVGTGTWELSPLGHPEPVFAPAMP